MSFFSILIGLLQTALLTTFVTIFNANRMEGIETIEEMSKGTWYSPKMLYPLEIKPPYLWIRQYGIQVSSTPD
jgi:hypothetical protein